MTKDKTAVWVRGADHYTRLAETESSQQSKLACLILASFCTHEWSGDRGGPSLEMLQLAEGILGIALDKVINDLSTSSEDTADDAVISAEDCGALGRHATMPRPWCPNSGPAASCTSLDEHVINDVVHAKCGQCGRLLKLRKNNALPRHRRPAMPPLARPEHEEDKAPERLPFSQSAEWEARNTISRGGVEITQDIYSDENCCYCFRKTRPDAQQLAMIRTHDGNWWLIDPTAPIHSDEWDRFVLPVGPDCLRNHPEWRFALVTRANGLDQG